MKEKMKALVLSVLIGVGMMISCSSPQELNEAQREENQSSKRERRNREFSIIEKGIGDAGNLEKGIGDAGNLEKKAWKRGAPIEIDERTRCNGFQELCHRRFDEVVFPATHNAMSSKEKGWKIPNQEFGMKRQLEDGIRAMALDTHYDNGQPYLCHGVCSLGKTPLVEGLRLIVNFLDSHPHEVFSIIFENYISNADTEKAVISSGLIDYVHTHERGTPWPTLAEMIQSQKRVVIFSEKKKEKSRPRWYHYFWSEAWDTPFAAKEPSDLKCTLGRGNKKNALFLLNHFLTNPFASPKWAKKVNFNPFFLERARRCQQKNKQLPNFVMVDFYSIGDLFDVVAKLNGLK